MAMSNQKPHSVNETTHTANSKKTTLGFDDKGICDACKYAEAKDKKIDWEEREKKLLELLDKFRKKDGSYDCIVSGSGEKR